MSKKIKAFKACFKACSIHLGVFVLGAIVEVQIGVLDTIASIFQSFS